MRTSPQLTSPMKQLLDKLTSRGSASLDDTELLTLLLGEGGEQAAARRLAERLLEYYDGALARLGRDPLPRLRMVEGMGQRRAARIAARERSAAKKRKTVKFYEAVCSHTEQDGKA